MSINFYILIITFGRPNGIRIRVCAVTVRYPRPLDDRTIMVVGVGLEPTNSKRADLQSAVVAA